ncbi:unnamed protein product, partial [Clonostachys chloroleuca]
MRAKKEIVLYAGAVDNRRLLLLSEIGPRQHLESINAPAICDLPGVGPFRGWIKQEIALGPHITTDYQVDQYARDISGTVYHPAYTTKMGDVERMKWLCKGNYGSTNYRCRRLPGHVVCEPDAHGVVLVSGVLNWLHKKPAGSATRRYCKLAAETRRSR